MTFLEHMKLITTDQLQGAIQDLNSESAIPDKAVSVTLRRAADVPAFGEVVRVMQDVGRKEGINSLAVARAEGMRIIFEALIAIAESEKRSW